MPTLLTWRESTRIVFEPMMVLGTAVRLATAKLLRNSA